MCGGVASNGAAPSAGVGGKTRASVPLAITARRGRAAVQVAWREGRRRRLIKERREDKEKESLFGVHTYIHTYIYIYTYIYV